MTPTTPVAILVKALVLSILSTSAASAAPDAELAHLARIEHQPISEISGIARSGYPGVFWVHNDSGDSARLFAVLQDGSVVIPDYLRKRYTQTPWPGLTVFNAWNVDWEDMTRSAAGTLYLADTGNNGNARTDLGVYVLPEPNPGAVPSSRALKFLPVRYPEQRQYPAREWHYDCEAVFHADGKLYFLTKHRKPGEIVGWAPGTRLYRLDTAFTDEINVLTLVTTNEDVLLATGADISPDGTHLAVSSYLGVWLFARPLRGDRWLNSASQFVPVQRETARTLEAVTWMDSNSLLLANEEGDLFRLKLSSLPQGTSD